MSTTTDNMPLAERMRPASLDEYQGQQHLIGPHSVLRQAIGSGTIPSMILWGPPGTGKTTLAHIISQTLDRPFHSLSAIHSGVKDVREVIDRAKGQGMFAKGMPVLFIDEIHRFSKSQQDSLLAAVERGIVTLIGATTENPSFEVISALLSRCQVYILKELDRADLETLLEKGRQKLEQETGKRITVAETPALLRVSGGDARKLLNSLELVVRSLQGDTLKVTNEAVMHCIQQNMPSYDKNGENHYDIISAFIKSMRGSDPNGAVYWLARMVRAGEDPKFIARRMLILASEDIGAANPTALVLANSCFQAVNVIGYPEAEIILSQCAVYLATSPKSNATYRAIKDAKTMVEEKGDLPVPLHLRNAPTKLMKDIGYGKDYGYAHDHPGNFVEQEFLPDAMKGTPLYTPQDNAREKADRDRLARLWKGKYGY
ncbi:MAG: replication-associated recombination protein A [Flavobacteriales bacterium]|nr:replication-associated recombination protein A [Flavobacteriales bacterium]